MENNIKQIKDLTDHARDFFEKCYMHNETGSSYSSKEELTMALLEELDLIKQRKNNLYHEIKIVDLGSGKQDLLKSFLSYYQAMENDGNQQLLTIPIDIVKLHNFSPLPNTVMSDINQLAIKDKSVDIIISNMTLSLLPEQSLKKEIYRILKRGGVLLATLHNFNSEMYTPPEKFKNLLEEYGIARGNMDDIKQRFVKAGFNEVNIREYQDHSLSTGELYEDCYIVRAVKGD